MINLKVKTLDSQIYDCTVDDEITVHQFKHHIAETTHVPANLQRLIYCGRVLVDERPLKDYDVNGKVIHVVERPPPSSRSSAARPNVIETPHVRRNRNGAQLRGHMFRAIDGMFLGSRTIPVNQHVQTSNLPLLNPSPSFCMNRIIVARHMLDCANHIAAYLENPERGLHNQSLDIITQDRWTVESTVLEVGISEGANVDFAQNHSQNFLEVFRTAVLAAVRPNDDSNNILVAQSSTIDANEINLPNSTTLPVGSNHRNNYATFAVNTTTSGTQITASGAASATANVNATIPLQSTQNNNQTESNRPSPTTGTNVLAEVIGQMRCVQTRLEPFIQQYYEILLNDPTFEETDTEGRVRAQQIFDRVSESFHYMSHAQHAISDLMVDLSFPAPRYLWCRPILIEQNGFLNSNDLATFLQSRDSRQQVPNITRIVAGGSSPVSINNSLPNLTQIPENGDIPTITTSNIAEHGELNPSSFIPLNQMLSPQDRIESSSIRTTAEYGIESTSIRSTNTERRQIAEIISNVAPRRRTLVYENPPIENDFHLEESTSASIGSSNIATSTTISFANTDNSENRIRGAERQHVTTDTYPTTSTRTRSTSRPQVHIANVPPYSRVIPSNVLSAFDRFLPCSSHHIKENEEQRSPQNHQQQQEQYQQERHQQQQLSQQNLQQQLAQSDHPQQMQQQRYINTSRNILISAVPSRIRNRPGGTDTLSTRYHTSRQIHFHHPPCAIRTVPLRATPTSGMNIQPTFSLSIVSSQQQQQLQEQQLQQQDEVQQPQLYGSHLHEDESNNAINHLSNNNFNTSINLFGMSLTLRDLVQISSTSHNILNRIRNELLAYIVNNLFAGRPINDENMNSAITTLIEMLNETLIYLPQFDLLDYDARASIENYIRIRLPIIINLMNEDNTSEFDTRLLREFLQFIQRLFFILITCVGRNNAELYLNQMVTSAELVTDQQSVQFLQRHLMSIIVRQLDSTEYVEDIQQYLVIRRSNIVPDSISLNLIRSTDDDSAVVHNSTPASSLLTIENIELRNSVISEQVQGQQMLETVSADAELWHTNFPLSWIPIITTDIDRQRLHYNQPPYSDAYISGMSVKRRKLPSTVPLLLADGIKNAFQESGIEPSNTNNPTSSSAVALDDIAATIVSDTTVQASYCEELRSNIKYRLETDSDFDNDKFPNTSNYFK